jgi:isopentenyldiphosphate isomerase
MDPEEYLEIVDYKGEVIGRAPRSEVHGKPSLMHRVVHILVLNKKGEILLQKRSRRQVGYVCGRACRCGRRPYICIEKRNA